MCRAAQLVVDRATLCFFEYTEGLIAASGSELHGVMEEQSPG